MNIVNIPGATQSLSYVKKHFALLVLAPRPIYSAIRTLIIVLSPSSTVNRWAVLGLELEIDISIGWIIVRTM